VNPMPRVASIVIPAHNEEHRIRPLMAVLSEPCIASLYDAYVICNGCTDHTREVAEEYPNVRVVEIEQQGKHYALNEGDRLAGDVFPRLYCDADIDTTAESIRALVDALCTDSVRVAGPTVNYGLNRSSWAVGFYVRAITSELTLRWHNEHLMGRGVYGASRAARQRFGEFPDLVADDLFFDRLFSLEEKVIVADSRVTVWMPSNLHTLVRGEIRVAEGNQQYLMHGEGKLPASGRLKRWLAGRRQASRRWRTDVRVRDVVPLAFYFCVTTAAKATLAIRKVRGHQIEWR